MKTVFQRTLSVIMCVILVMGTMSTMAYAATDFTYDKFMDTTSKSVDMNTIQLLDEVDELLAKANIVLDLEEVTGVALGTVDLTSVDKALKSIDGLRNLLDIVTIAFSDLNTLTFDALESGMTRSEDGDVKIILELLEFVGSNGDIVSNILSGNFSLGAVDKILAGEDGDGFKFSEVPNMLKGLLVDLFYNDDDAGYDAAYSRATTDFDAFMCQDIIPYVIAMLTDAIGLDPANSKLTIDTTSTVNTIIAKIFDIIIVNVKTVIGSLNVELKDTAFAGLEGKLNLMGSTYQLEGIGFDGNTSVLSQINTVLGQIFAQIVPGYTAWEAGDCTKIENNVRNTFFYLAEEAGFDTTKSDTEVMVDVLKAIFDEVNLTGDYSNCATLEDMAKELIKSIAIDEELLPEGTTYTAAQTYEHVLGDILISLLHDDVILATPDGKICEVGAGYDVWSVLNYILNFSFVDKNLDLLLGKDGMTKTSTLFQKLDIIFDMFADDGTSAFATETYFKSLINSVFTLDIGKFVELTAVKALNFAKAGGSDVPGSVTVSEFVYKGLYAFLYNWAGKKEVIPAFTSSVASAPFNNALSGRNLGKFAEALVTALSGCTYKFKTFLGVPTNEKDIVSAGASRAPAICSGVGLLIDGYETVSVDIASVSNATYTGNTLNPDAVVYATYGRKTIRLEQNIDYKVVVENNAIGSTTASIVGIRAYNGTAVHSVPINVALAGVSGLTAKPASTTSVTLSWNKVPGATSYNIYNGSTLVKNVTTNSYTVTGLKAGTKYTLKAEAVSGNTKSAAASVNTVTLPAQVTNLKATPSSTSVKLTWTAAAGAAGYYVQSYVSGAWKNVATVTKNTATVSATVNKAYSFRVIAYSTNASGAKYNGAASATLAVRSLPATPSSLAKKSVTSSSVTLSWKAVAGATGYQICDSNGKVIATTKSTSYTISKLSANTTYKYKIRAYVTAGGKNYFSAYTSTVSAKTLLAAPKSLSASAKKITGTSITASWKKVSGAKKYQVYYSTNKKTWKRAATTSKTSYKITELKANTKYYIKVRAYNSSSVYGDYSSVLTTSTAPSKVSIKSLKAGSKKATVTWKKVSGVTGYEVQYATSSNFKKGLKTTTVKKASTVKKTIKKLSKGKKYYFRVRAYKTVNGEKLYGKYSEYEVVKVK